MLWTRLLPALCVVIMTIVTASQAVAKCEDELTSTTNYTMEVIIKWDIDDIDDIDISHHTDNIYFVDHQRTLHVIYKGKQKAEQIIMEDTKVRAVAVDKHVANVYIGHSYGLKMYNEYTTSVTDVAGINHLIWQLFLPKNSNAIYAEDASFSVYRYSNISSVGHKLQNVKINRFYGDRFVVDEEENYFFTSFENDRRVTKILRQGSLDPVTYNDGRFYDLGVDNAARVYGIANWKLYRLKADGSEPQLIILLNYDAWQVRFDKDNNIIFVTQDNRIVKYKFDLGCVTSDGIENVRNNRNE